MTDVNRYNRIELAVQMALPLELGLVCAHAMFPNVAALPLGGSEIAQVGLVLVTPIVVVELCHWGRRCYRSIRAWWDEV